MCGEVSGFVESSCGCGHSVRPLVYSCNLRTCPICAKKRKKKLFKTYMPVFRRFKPNRKFFYYFLTISPRNYNNLSDGLKTIKKNFKKFLRLKYIKERILGVLYNIEIKESNGLWNIHIHSIVYGRWIDNKIRFVGDDSRIVSLWKKSSGEEVNMHVQRQSTPEYTLNYLLKYITISKENFDSVFSMSEFLIVTHKQRLIQSAGFFYNHDEVKFLLRKTSSSVCPKCGFEITFFVVFDQEAVKEWTKPPPKCKHL